MKPLVVAAASLLFAAPLLAQEEGKPLPAQPTKGQEQVPGLQQTPDGQIMKTVGEWTRPLLETQAGFMTTSTGPTFPDPPTAK